MNNIVLHVTVPVWAGPVPALLPGLVGELPGPEGEGGAEDLAEDRVDLELEGVDQAGQAGGMQNFK